MLVKFMNAFISHSYTSRITGFAATRHHRRPNSPPSVLHDQNKNAVHRLFVPHRQTPGSKNPERFSVTLHRRTCRSSAKPGSTAAAARGGSAGTDGESRCHQPETRTSKSPLRQQNAQVLAQKQKRSHHNPEGDISAGIAFPTEV